MWRKSYYKINLCEDIKPDLSFNLKQTRLQCKRHFVMNVLGNNLSDSYFYIYFLTDGWMKQGSYKSGWSLCFKGPVEMLCHKRYAWCWYYNPPRRDTCSAPRQCSRSYTNLWVTITTTTNHHTNVSHQSYPVYPLPVAACILFKTLVLAYRIVKGPALSWSNRSSLNTL